MKKVAKLSLKKDVLRTLVDKDLEKAKGGLLTDGCGHTYAGSGCSSWGAKCTYQP